MKTSLIWKYIEDENGERSYCKMEIFILSLQNFLIFEEIIEKDKVSAPDWFHLCIGCDKISSSGNMTNFLEIRLL